MKSPFKMMPGRGSMPKTGRGIPPTLMCSPMKQMDTDPIKKNKKATSEIELTKKYDTGKKDMASARSNAKTKKSIESAQGMKVNAKTGKASAKGYEKKIVSNKTHTMVVDGSGKAISKVKNRDTKGVADLKAKYNTGKKYTEKTRGSNKELYNATSGGTKPEKLSTSQKERLVRLGKARKK